MHVSKTTITLTFLLLPFFAHLQELNILWFNRLNTFPNFTPSFNYFVFHDSEGFVWISSTAGLNRFDGTRVKHYNADLADSTSLYTGENIQSTFFEDKQKNLWFTTTEAIHCYVRSSDSFLHYKVKNKNGLTVDTGYRAFFLEKDSFLWMVADTTIHRFNIHAPNASTFVINCTNGFYAADTLQNGNVAAIYRLGNIKETAGQYWTVNDGQLQAIKKWFNGYDKKTPNSIYDIILENDTKAWLGTDKGLASWNPSTRDLQYFTDPSFGKCLLESWGKDYLIIWSLKKGLFSFNKKEKKISMIEVRLTNGMKVSNEDVFNIYIDPSDNLWVSLMGSGLLFGNLNKTKFHSTKKKPDVNGNSSYNYWATLWDSNDNFWQGTNTSGLFLTDRKIQTTEQFRHDSNSPKSLPNDWVLSLLHDKKERIWVGTQKGLSWTSPKNKGIFHPVLFNNSQDLPIIGLCQLEPSGTLLASTNNGEGIFMVQEKNGKESLKRICKNGVGYGILFVDSYNRIYCSHNDLSIDVFTFNNDTLTLVTTLPVQNIITGYFEDKANGNLWISSLSGLTRTDLDSLHSVTMITDKNGLPDKNIHSMLADRLGNLWLATAKGLATYNIRNGHIHQFSLADGVQSSEFQLAACAKRQNDELWFGGTDGFTIIDNRPIDSVRHKPICKITGIKINDEQSLGLADFISGATNINQIKNIKLPYDQNTISFEFAAIEYSDPANNKLWYKLEGEDENWIELKIGEPAFTRYSNLWARTYHFWLKAENSDGVMGEPQMMIKIIIKPPFWYRWEFILSMAVLLASATWVTIRYRIAQIRIKADLNTRVAENKMAALRSQMNPHFVFNSLQTVNGLIARQDLRGAMEYVNEFARLMRVILENSREGNISLEREIELLELYMKIESRRFPTPFTFSITVGQNVDTYSMEIPSMLLQPFVENAIKHGLFHNKGGHISIAFLNENGSLKCVIEDNGIGRAKAAEFNAQEGRGHKSRGLQIVSERLAIISASKFKTYEVKTTDLFDRQQKPTGTRVEITLPFT